MMSRRRSALTTRPPDGEGEISAASHSPKKMEKRSRYSGRANLVQFLRRKSRTQKNKVAYTEDPPNSDAHSLATSNPQLMSAHPSVSAARKTPHHRNHGAHPHGKDSTNSNSMSVVLYPGNIKTGNSVGEVAGTKYDGREKRKLSKHLDYSFNHKMFRQSADHPLSMRELNRIKRYHTVDIDTDFIANFNYDFMNDNVV